MVGGDGEDTREGDSESEIHEPERRIPVASCQNPKATKTYIFKFRLKFEPKTKKDPGI